MKEKISAATIARTLSLMLALLNQILVVSGYAIIPISDEDLNTLISSAWTIGSALVAWWYNNSFTQAAIKADKLLEGKRVKGA